eukprot:TRINITY_DN5215_c0_g1_i2.p1 TRINITY_DN5215_c0_g1~~TRINITY_DN5215_c0_g1_i2.p1  ORF type:complete len:145 (-),score=64.25 TRINITY_DN5215_c0_g1_i2:241-642(-)
MANIEEEEDASLLKFGADFANARCLLNSEVAILMENSRMNQEDSESEPSVVFTKTLNHVKRFSKYKNKTAVKEIRALLTKKGLEEYEVASLSNLCPDNFEEAKTLIPSLGRDTAGLSDQELTILLNDLRVYSN